MREMILVGYENETLEAVRSEVFLILIMEGDYRGWGGWTMGDCF